MKQPQQTDCTADTRRSFDDEFQRQAIALIESGRPVHHLAKEPPVTASMLYAWKRKFGSSVSPSTPAPPSLSKRAEQPHAAVLAPLQSSISDHAECPFGQMTV